MCELTKHVAMIVFFLIRNTCFRCLTSAVTFRRLLVSLQFKQSRKRAAVKCSPLVRLRGVHMVCLWHVSRRYSKASVLERGTVPSLVVGNVVLVDSLF
jgi:hypothetical protein